MFEVGYNNTLSINGSELFDYSIAAIHSDDVGVRTRLERDDDTSLVLTISKTFGAE